MAKAPLIVALTAVVLSIFLSACKIVATPNPHPVGSEDASEDGFDPNAMVSKIWDSKVIPYLTAKASALPDVVAAVRANPDEAGRKFGYRAKEGNVPWTFPVRFEGKIVGENGAGKSTLMKIIAGVESPTAGRILLDGKPVVFTDSADAAANGVGIVFQELNLFGNLSVAENIFAARELTRGALGIDHGLQERRAGELLERLEAGIDPRTPVEDLRIGQQQLVEIAKAVAQNARILILDEPTSALSAPEVEVLFWIIGDLKSRVAPA